MRVISKYNRLWIGLIPGLLVPMISFFVFSIFKSKTIHIILYIKFVMSFSVLSKILSLCVIPNLAVFYFFINKEFYYSARGVILATLIWAIFIVIILYFT